MPSAENQRRKSPVASSGMGYTQKRFGEREEVWNIIKKMPPDFSSISDCSRRRCEREEKTEIIIMRKGEEEKKCFFLNENIITVVEKKRVSRV